jgi:hypothetical protein
MPATIADLARGTLFAAGEIIKRLLERNGQ